MADIELVVKIPEYMFEDIQDRYRHPNKGDGINLLEYAVAKGIPLPKGHGDLKDADKLKHAFITWSMAVQGYFTDSDIASIVYNSPTIIEANRSESEVQYADSN